MTARHLMLLAGGTLLGILALIVLLPRPHVPQTGASADLPAPDLPLTTQLYRVRLSAARHGWSADHHRQAAELAGRLGDPHTAAGHWQAVLTRQPEQQAVLRTLAAYALDAQRWTLAVDLLTRWLAVQPDDPWGSAWLGLLYAPTQPEAAQTLLEAGGDTEAAAVGAVLATLREYPANDPALAFRLGGALAAQEYWALAERAFFHAAARGALSAEALASVGVARAAQGKPGATAWVQAALTLAPLNPQVHTLHALYLELVRDMAGAAQALETAARLDPTNPALAVMVGQMYQARGDANTAEYWLRLGVALAGDDRYDRLLADFYTAYAAQLDALRQAEQAAYLDMLLTTPEAQNTVLLLRVLQALLIAR